MGLVLQSQSQTQVLESNLVFEVGILQILKLLALTFGRPQDWRDSSLGAVISDAALALLDLKFEFLQLVGFLKQDKIQLLVFLLLLHQLLELL